jgi:hypothetical protein
MSHLPTQSAKCVDDRRSSLKIPHWRVRCADPGISQNIRLRGSAQAIISGPPASKANARTSIRRGGRDQHRALAQHGCWQSHCPPQCATARARRLSPQASAAVPRSTALPKPSVGQGLPLAPGPHDVESPIQHLAHLPGRSCRPPAR